MQRRQAFAHRQALPIGVAGKERSAKRIAHASHQVGGWPKRVDVGREVEQIVGCQSKAGEFAIVKCTVSDCGHGSTTFVGSSLYQRYTSLEHVEYAQGCKAYRHHATHTHRAC